MQKRTIFGYVLIAFIAFNIGNIYRNEYVHESPSINANLVVLIERPGLKEQIFIGNVLTDLIENEAINFFGFDNVTLGDPYNYIALGNSTITQTKTKLDTEATSTGLTRAVATTITKWTYSGDRAYNASKKFTATGNIAVNAASLHRDGTSNSDNNMGALASLGATYSLQNNWNITILWMMVFDYN